MITAAEYGKTSPDDTPVATGAPEGISAGARTQRSSTPGLPRLMLIADGFTDPDVAARTIEAARSGVPWIQLRDHAAEPDAFDAAADSLLDALAGLSGPPLVSVNSRLDFADTRRTAFHTGMHGPAVENAARRLGNDAIIGVSVHSSEEADAAQSGGAHYTTFSPVYSTASKPGHDGHGLAALGDVAARLDPIPVLALGGVTPGRVAACLDAGAYGVAVVRGILHADDMERAIRLYSDSLSKAQAQDAS